MRTLKIHGNLNPFVRNAPFLYYLKTSEKPYGFLIFSGVTLWVYWERMGSRRCWLVIPTLVQIFLSMQQDCTMKSQIIYCNYCNIPKLKNLFSKSLAPSLLNWTKKHVLVVKYYRNKKGLLLVLQNENRHCIFLSISSYIFPNTFGPLHF